MPDRFSVPGIVGNTDVPRLSVPQLRARIRRADADGSHTAPFYSGLNGLTLIVQRGNGLTVIGTTTITFTSDVYVTALADITGTGVLTGVDSDGFLTVQSGAAGDANYVKLTGGTALAVLGMDVFPLPAGFSQAGDLAPSPPNRSQSNPQTSGLLSHDENLNSLSINRAVLSAGQHAELLLADLSREVAVPKHFSVTVPNEGGSTGTHFVLTGGDLDERLCIETFLQSSSGSRTNAFRLSDSSGNQAVSNVIPDGVEVELDAVIYGTIPLIAGFSSVVWGTPDSKDVLTTGTYTKFKVTSVGISSIRGNILIATGAQFVTNKVQEGDHIKIASATNTSPFSHNGELAVSQVIDENTLLIRPLGTNEYQCDATLRTPPGLNQAGSGLGSVSVFVGKFVRMGMKGSGGTDLLSFVLSQPVPSGSYIATIPVATTLRKMGTQVFADAVRSDSDAAFQGQANFFTAAEQFFKNIKLGANLDTSAATAATPRLIMPALDPTDTGDANTLVTGIFQAIHSFGGFGSLRLYAHKSTGLYITLNAVYNGGTGLWNKDAAGHDAWRLAFFNDFEIHRRVSDAAWNDSSWDPVLFSQSASTTAIGQQLSLGFNNLAAGLGDLGRIVTTATATPDSRTLLWQGNPGSGGSTQKSRIYWFGNTLEFVINAGYNNTSALWTKDLTSVGAARVKLTKDGLAFYSENTGSATPFADGAWNSGGILSGLSSAFFAQLQVQGTAAGTSLVVGGPTAGGRAVDLTETSGNVDPLLQTGDSLGKPNVSLSHRGMLRTRNIRRHHASWFGFQNLAVTSTGYIASMPPWILLSGSLGTGGAVLSWSDADPNAGLMVVRPGNANGNNMTLAFGTTNDPPAVSSGNSYGELEWYAFPDATLSNSFWTMGYIEGAGAVGSGKGIFFLYDGSSPNWFAVCADNAGGGSTVVNTGIPANVPHLFAIEYDALGRGATQVARFFIDDSLVVTTNSGAHATSFPSTGGVAFRASFGGSRTGASTDALNLGPVNITAYI